MPSNRWSKWCGKCLASASRLLRTAFVPHTHTHSWGTYCLSNSPLYCAVSVALKVVGMSCANCAPVFEHAQKVAERNEALQEELVEARQTNSGLLGQLALLRRGTSRQPR